MGYHYSGLAFSGLFPLLLGHFPGIAPFPFLWSLWYAIPMLVHPFLVTPPPPPGQSNMAAGAQVIGMLDSR